jgi:hypothetical protein
LIESERTACIVAAIHNSQCTDAAKLVSADDLLFGNDEPRQPDMKVDAKTGFSMWKQTMRGE